MRPCSVWLLTLAASLRSDPLTLDPPVWPPTEKPKLPENFYDNTWAKLLLAIQAVHSQQAVASSQEELYRVSAALVVVAILWIDFLRTVVDRP